MPAKSVFGVFVCSESALLLPKEITCGLVLSQHWSVDPEVGPNLPLVLYPLPPPPGPPCSVRCLQTLAASQVSFVVVLCRPTVKKIMSCAAQGRICS